MHISIIIVNYNGYPDLERCLNSLYQCGDLQDTEIIIVDNCSTDGSAARLRSSFPLVTVIQNHSNHGFGHGNNLGRSYACGDYLVFLNPDTVVTPGWLKPMIEALESRPRVGLVTPRLIQLSDPATLNACGHQVHLSGIVQCRGQGQPIDIYPDLEVVNAISGAAFVIRREIFDHLGGFDAPFFLFIEDTDLSWRAWLAGYECLFIPTSQIYHDYQLTFGPRKLFYYERNRYNLLLKNLHWRTLFVLLPVLLLVELIGWGFVLLYDRPNWRNKLDAYAWVIRSWSVLIKERRRVQSLRKVSDRDLLKNASPHLAFEQVGSSMITRLASSLFNPIFSFYRIFLLMAIRW
jgi:GT2 family glycosyltransferase